MIKIFSDFRSKKWNNKLLFVSALLLFFVFSMLFSVFAYYFVLELLKPEKIYTREEISSLVDQNLFIKAEQVVKSKLKVDPDNCQLKIDLANIYLSQANNSGLVDKKLLDTRDALQKMEENKDCLSDRLYSFFGYSYEVVGDFQSAERIYDQGLTVFPDSVELLFQKGHLLWLKGDLDGSLSNYLKAERFINDDKIDRNIKGKLMMALATHYGSNGRDIEKAEHYFLQAISVLNSQQLKSETYFNLSTLYFYYKNDSNKSLEYAKKAIKANNKNDLGYIAFARSTIKNLPSEGDRKKISDDIKIAGKYLSQALLINPRRTLAYYWMAQLAFLTGDTDGALKILNQAEKRCDNDSTLGAVEKILTKGEIYFAKGVIYHSLANQPEAEKYFRMAFEKNPVKTTFMMDKMNIDRDFFEVKSN